MSGPSAHRSIKTLHLQVQAAHPTPRLLQYEPMLDQQVEGRC